MAEIKPEQKVILIKKRVQESIPVYLEALSNLGVDTNSLEEASSRAEQFTQTRRNATHFLEIVEDLGNLVI